MPPDGLKILCVAVDNNLGYKEQISVILKKVYAKIAVLRRLKRLLSENILLTLIGISRTPNKKLENANYYGLRTVLNTRKSISTQGLKGVGGGGVRELESH